MTPGETQAPPAGPPSAPTAAPTAALTAAPTEAPREADTRALTTLVVDDEPLVAEELAFFLVRRGLPALIAHRAAEALDIISQRPDIGVVVTDIRMPGASGLELAAELARTRGDAPGDTGGPGVILITGHATLDDAVAAVRAGAFDFLRKPFRLSELEASVRRVLERTNERRQRESLRVSQAAQVETVSRALASLRGTDAETGLLTRAGMLDAVAALARPEEAQPACVMSAKIIFSDTSDGVDDAGSLAAHKTLAALRLAASRRLRQAAGVDDVIGRLATDEFAILRTGADAQNCAAWVTRLREALGAPYHVDDLPKGGLPEIRPLVKIGAAHSARLNDVGLWQAGQLALAIAALRPGSSVEWFDPDPRYSGRIRHVLQQRIRDGLIGVEFQFHFQPIFSVDDRKLTGFEALLRWHDPEHGIISPADFVPIAEEYGLIPAVDEMLLRRAIEHARKWRQDFGFTGRLNVNVSPITLREPSYAAAVVAALREADLPPARICLEITEAVALEPAIRESLAAIRAAGVAIAIDDFGSGHSSLARLLELPADVVKFDRAFLHAAGSDQALAEFLNSSIRLARLRNLRVVAEGVETSRDWDLVRRAGFDFAQGYWLGVPLEAADAEQLMVRP